MDVFIASDFWSLIELWGDLRSLSPSSQALNKRITRQAQARSRRGPPQQPHQPRRQTRTNTVRAQAGKGRPSCRHRADRCDRGIRRRATWSAGGLPPEPAPNGALAARRGAVRVALPYPAPARSSSLACRRSPAKAAGLKPGAHGFGAPRSARTGAGLLGQCQAAGPPEGAGARNQLR